MYAPSGELRGLAVHVELHVDDARAPPEVSSARAGSHWPNLLLQLQHGAVNVRAGERLFVRAECELGGTQPRYEFELLREAGEEGGGDGWTSLAVMSYP